MTMTVAANIGYILYKNRLIRDLKRHMITLIIRGKYGNAQLKDGE